MAVAKVIVGKYYGLEDPGNITTLENVFVSNVHFASQGEGEPVFYFDALQAKNVCVSNVCSLGGHALEKQNRPQPVSEPIRDENIRTE